MVPGSIRGLHELSHSIEIERQQLFDKNGLLDTLKKSINSFHSGNGNGGKSSGSGDQIVEGTAFGILGRPKPISPLITTAKPPF